MRSQALPSGWERLPLEAVLATLPSGSKLQQGWSPQCDKGAAGPGEWGVLKTTAIQPGIFADEHQKRLPGHLAPRPTIEVQSGDLLLTNAGPRARCGIPCLVRSTRPRLMLSGKVYRFRADQLLMEPRFLEYFLLDPDTQRAIDRMKTGISDSGLNLTRSRFLALPVVVPPPAEQRRIVEILEDHLSRLDAAGGLLRSGISRVRAWHRGSVDRILWSSGHGEDSGLTPVGSLLGERMRNGHSARASRSGEGVRTLTLTAVTRNDFSDEFTKVTTADVDRVEDLWLQPGDILVQRANTAELVGTTAIYEGDPSWAIFPDLLIRLRADSSQILPRYLAASLRSERAHRALRAKAKGLAGSMPKIDHAAIAEVRVPVPGRREQQRRVEQLEVVDASRAALLADLNRALKRAETLRRSLLEAAFSGRLT